MTGGVFCALNKGIKDWYSYFGERNIQFLSLSKIVVLCYVVLCMIVCVNSVRMNVQMCSMSACTYG